MLASPLSPLSPVPFTPRGVTEKSFNALKEHDASIAGAAMRNGLLFDDVNGVLLSIATLPECDANRLIIEEHLCKGELDKAKSVVVNIPPPNYCVPCKTQFPTPGKYQKHVEFSTAHKEAVAKLEQEKAAAAPKPSLSPLSSPSNKSSRLVAETALDGCLLVHDAVHFFWRVDIRLSFQIFKLIKHNVYMITATDIEQKTEVQNSTIFFRMDKMDEISNTLDTAAVSEDGGAPVGRRSSLVRAASERSKKFSASKEEVPVATEGDFTFVSNKVNRRKSSLGEQAIMLKRLKDSLKVEKDNFFKCIMDRLDISLSDVEGQEFKIKTLTYKASVSDPKDLLVTPTEASELLVESQTAIRMFSKRFLNGNSEDLKMLVDQTSLALNNAMTQINEWKDGTMNRKSSLSLTSINSTSPMTSSMSSFETSPIMTSTNKSRTLPGLAI